MASDMGDRKTVGGLADDFFKRIVKFYTDKYGAASKEAGTPVTAEIDSAAPPRASARLSPR